MQQLQDVQEALISALWNEITPEQAARALDRLGAEVGRMALDEDSDAAAAGWLAGLLRISGQ